MVNMAEKNHATFSHIPLGNSSLLSGFHQARCFEKDKKFDSKNCLFHEMFLSESHRLQVHQWHTVPHGMEYVPGISSFPSFAVENCGKLMKSSNINID